MKFKGKTFKIIRMCMQVNEQFSLSLNNQTLQTDTFKSKSASLFQKIKKNFSTLKSKYSDIQPIVVSGSNLFSYATMARIYDRMIDGVSALFSLTISKKSNWTSKVPLIIKIFSLVSLSISFVSAIKDFKRCLTDSHKIDYFLRGLENTSDVCSSLASFLSGMVLAGITTAKMAVALFSLSISGVGLSIAAVLYQSKQIHHARNFKQKLEKSGTLDELLYHIQKLDDYELEQRLNLRVDLKGFKNKIKKLNHNPSSINNTLSFKTLLIDRIDNSNLSRSLLVLTSAVICAVMTAMIFSPAGPLALSFLVVAGALALLNAHTEYRSINNFYKKLEKFIN